jgi:hypothetical protein
MATDELWIDPTPACFLAGKSVAHPSKDMLLSLARLCK